MSKLIILGSSNAIPHENQDNTHLAVVSRKRKVLIDCANNPSVRLSQVDIDFIEITDIILTHFHPDHIAGAPPLLMQMWLLGRQDPLNIHGLSPTLDKFKKMMELYDWDNWPNFYSVNFYPVEHKELAQVIDDDDLKIYASPVYHLIPNIGLRIEFPESSKVLAYSSDTEPCPAVVNLAQNADVLIHEAAGLNQGHSSASQAGGIAKDANVKSLYLIHYPPEKAGRQSLVSQAEKVFNGQVELAEDFMEFSV